MLSAIGGMVNEEVEMTDAEKIQAFIASRGVTRVAEGERAYDGRSMYWAVRGEKAVDLTSRRVVWGHDHLGRAIIVNGLGELIAVE